MDQYHQGNDPEFIDPNDPDIQKNRINRMAALDLNNFRLFGSLPQEALADMYGIADSQELLVKRAADYGAGSFKTSVIVFEAGGYPYFHFSDAIEYDGRWHLYELGGTMAGMMNLLPDFHGTMPIDPQAWQEIQAQIIPFE